MPKPVGCREPKGTLTSSRTSPAAGGALGGVIVLPSGVLLFISWNILRDHRNFFSSGIPGVSPGW